MKLISMKDFVLEQDKVASMSGHYDRIVKYANFLNQPLELWMFQGENKLFEGFSVTSTKPKSILFNGWNLLSQHGLKKHNINYLVGIRLTMQGENVMIDLTPSAIKKIGYEL